MLHPQRFQGVDICLIGDFGGEDAVPPPVAGEKGNLHPLQLADNYSVAGLAEGGIYIDFLDIGQPLNLIQPRPPMTPILA